MNEINEQLRLIENFYVALNEGRVAELRAKYLHNYRLELMNQGFSLNDAQEILLEDIKAGALKFEVK